MAGKQAKVLLDHHVQALLAYSQHSRQPIRNRVIVLLSVKAGLRAGEIANLTWPMVIDPSGEIATAIEFHNLAALEDVVTDPAILKMWADTGVSAFPKEERSPTAGRKLLKSETARWGKVIRDNNIHVDQ